jgi:hypothetical protein
MNSDRAKWFALALLPLLAACEDGMGGVKSASAFGEANEMTNMAQVIDPDPQYEDAVPVTSARSASQAVDRYNTDTVKKPVRQTSTTSISNSTGSKQ